jgi:DNA-binding Xre family transcriptional regulator
MTTAATGEAARIMMNLKRMMKSRGITYRELARRIDLSEVSVKRIFSRSSLSLSRLEGICQALDVSMQEITRLYGEPAADTAEFLTLEQESALAADPSLLACYYLIANGRTGREIGAELGVEERQVRRWMVKLHSFGLLELRSKLRARARTTSSITWRLDGPVRRLYERQVRQEFLQSSFAGSSEAMHFRSAELSDASCRVLLRKLERLATEFRDLAELDRSLPARDKRSMALVVAARPWVFSMFEGLRHFTGRAESPKALP